MTRKATTSRTAGMPLRTLGTLASMAALLLTIAGPAAAAQPPTTPLIEAAFDDCREEMSDSDPREYDLWTDGTGGHTWGQVWVDRILDGYYKVCVHNGVKDHYGDGRAAIAYARFELWDGNSWEPVPWYVFARADGVAAPSTYTNILFGRPLRNFKMGVCLGPESRPIQCNWENV